METNDDPEYVIFMERLGKFLKAGLKESAKVRYNYNCRLNIAYGDSFREKLDIYGDELKSNSIFVFVHGGCWQYGDKWGSSFFAGSLIEKGIRVIVVGYDLCPQKDVEQAIHQVQKAFMWISEYVEENDIKSVSIAGHSAGAHLVACSLTKDFVVSLDGKVKLDVYAISGLYDLKMIQHEADFNPNNVLGVTDDNVHLISPVYHDYSYLQANGVKFYILFGDLEAEATKEFARDFKERALKNLSTSELKTICGVDHFTIVERLSDPNYELNKFIVANSMISFY